MTVHMVVLKRSNDSRTSRGECVLGVYGDLQAAYDRVADLPLELQILATIDTYPVN